MSYTLISETTPVAKKAHICIWCGEKIIPGQCYVRERSVYDGEPQSHKWHTECRAAAIEYLLEGEDEFSPFENDRPASPGTIEFESWDCSLLAQGRMREDYPKATP